MINNKQHSTSSCHNDSSRASRLDKGNSCQLAAMDSFSSQQGVKRCNSVVLQWFWS